MSPTGGSGLPGQQMAQKRKRSTDHVDHSFSLRGGERQFFSKFEDLDDNDYAILFAAHLDMFDKFMDFCKQKRGKYVQKRSDKNKVNLGEENQQSMYKTEFKENLTRLFGEYLPAHVVNELCLLVKENSYGKCHYCSMPVESLVLSVLQILLDASENTKSASMKNHVNYNTLNKEAITARGTKEFGNEASLNRNATRTPTVLLPNSNEDLNIECHQQTPDKMSNGSEAIKSLMNKIKTVALPVLDTPVIVLGNELNRNRSILEEAPLIGMTLRRNSHCSIGEVRLLAAAAFQAPFANPSKESMISRNSLYPPVGLLCLILSCATIKCFAVLLIVNGTVKRELSYSKPPFHTNLWENQLNLMEWLMTSLLLDIAASFLMISIQGNLESTISTRGLAGVCFATVLNIKSIMSRIHSLVLTQL